MSACGRWRTRCGVAIDDGPLRDLRRLIYCGEWIESHALHVYMLHAPDFLGYAGAIEMAARPPRDRRAGPAAEEGRQRAHGARRRARDPPDQRPRRRLLPRADARASCARCVEPLERAREIALRDRALDRRAARSPTSSATRAASRCAEPGAYPIDRGRIVSDARPRHRARGVRRRTSSRSTSSTRTRCTRASASGGTYLTGPLARYA